MALSSPVFLFLFLPVLLSLHAVMPGRGKNILLLCASLFFYAWGDAHSLQVLGLSILGNYVFGLLLGRLTAPAQRKAFLAGAVCANLLLLVYYKYLLFIVSNLAALHLVSAQNLDFSRWHLPLGLSFFTFGAVSYLVDLYRSKTAPERSLVDLALYMALFPKIVAGPIVRYSELAQELKSRRIPFESFGQGAQRFVIGLGKKVLIANSAAVMADEIFQAQGTLDMPTAWLGILCYTLQIYFDFSGYSDMAIGLARMFGFTFGENFNYPYVSQSIQEFWRRWHISLSLWFRDYLYIPLGGNRGSSARIYFNLLAVFFLCGLWHGAGWNFIVWGLYHGAFLALERAGLGRVLEGLWRPVRHFYVVLVVMVGWVFFRSDNLSQALQYIQALFSFTWEGFDYFYMTFFSRQLFGTLCLGVVGSLPVPRILELLHQRLQGREGGRSLQGYGVHATLALVVFLLLVFVASAMQMAVSTYSPFIYTKF